MKKENVFKFLRFLVLPVIYGVCLSIPVWGEVTDGYLLGTLVVHCLVFCILMVARAIFFLKTDLFPATFTVFVGSFVELVSVYIRLIKFGTPNVHIVNLLIYILGMLLSVILLFSASIAITAIVRSRG